MTLLDVLTLPLAVLGLGVAGLLGGNVVIDANVGVVTGFAVFAAMGWLYRKMRGRDGLEIGDAKLLAGAGAWVGLPSVIFMGGWRSPSCAEPCRRSTAFRSGPIFAERFGWSGFTGRW